jgi:hypothetical protein
LVLVSAIKFDTRHFFRASKGQCFSEVDKDELVMRTYREGGRKLRVGLVGETEKGESGEEKLHFWRCFVARLLLNCFSFGRIFIL